MHVAIIPALSFGSVTWERYEGEWKPSAEAQGKRVVLSPTTPHKQGQTEALHQLILAKTPFSHKITHSQRV